MAKRQVFFSFEYGKDAWRASQVRNMGKVSDSSTFSDNDWEEVKNIDISMSIYVYDHSRKTFLIPMKGQSAGKSIVKALLMRQAFRFSCLEINMMPLPKVQL